MKKLLVTLAAVTVPVGLVAATGGVASAVTKTDVTNASISCTGVSGGLKFTPPITLTGTLPETISVKLALANCTVSGAPGVTVTSGKGSGSLTVATNNAQALAGTSVSGAITIKWKSNVALVSKVSTYSVHFLTGTQPTDGFAGLGVTSTSGSVAGDFSGGNGGATSSFYAETGASIATVTTQLVGPKAKGIKKLTLVSNNPGQTTPSLLALS